MGSAPPYKVGWGKLQAISTRINAENRVPFLLLAETRTTMNCGPDCALEQLELRVLPCGRASY